MTYGANLGLTQDHRPRRQAVDGVDPGRENLQVGQAVTELKEGVPKAPALGNPTFVQYLPDKPGTAAALLAVQQLRYLSIGEAVLAQGAKPGPQLLQPSLLRLYKLLSEFTHGNSPPKGQKLGKPIRILGCTNWAARTRLPHVTQAYFSTF